MLGTDQSNLRSREIGMSQIAGRPSFEPISMESRWYPLHVLCRRYNEEIYDHSILRNEFTYLDELQKVILSFPEAAALKTEEGWLPLHILCRNSVNSISAIQLVMNAFREAAKTPVDSDGWYPLHQVCKYSQSVEVIKMIYDAFPNAVRWSTEKGKFPNQLLHLNTSIENANFYDMVIRACPLLSINQQLNRAAVPIVQAVEMSDEEAYAFAESNDARQYSISTKAFTETATTPISGGLYLLHALCQQSAPLREITEALNAYPQAATMATDDGWLPLHLVCRNSDDFVVVRTLLEAYPGGASVPTPEGWYPLHQLCRYCHSLDAIKMMYEAFPSASSALSSKGSTPLSMLLKYFPLRADMGKVLINADEKYQNDISLALSVNVLSDGTEERTTIASPIAHSPFMGVVKLEDVCNMLDCKRK